VRWRLRRCDRGSLESHDPCGHDTVGELEAVNDPEAYYLISHNIMQNFAYTQDAKLIGERVYDDAARYQYEKLEPGDVVTQEMARAQLAPFLARATLD